MQSADQNTADIDLPKVILPEISYPTREELEADGYVIRVGGDEDGYHGDPCKHISLNVSIGKILVTECEEDAMRQHPRLGGKRKKPTAAMQEGSLFDRLLTGSLDYERAETPAVWERPVMSGKKVKKVDSVCYSDWNGLRVIDADAYTTAVVRECRDDARAKGLQPVLQEELVESVAEAKELLVRLELAGINLQSGQHQVPLYWVEFADDGTPVQCRGMLDQLDNSFTIRDLKKVESLRLEKLSRNTWEYGWDIQAAAYVNGLERITGEYGRVGFEWAFIRVGELPAARKVSLSGYRMELSRRRWRVAVNRWAKCMQTKFWRGYEMDPQAMSAEPWMDNQVSELEGVEDGE